MWKFAFKAATLVSAVVFSSLTASAMDQNVSPFALAKSQVKLSQSAQNYLNAGASLSRAELLSLDAKLHETYGNPTSSRGSLKIWEVANHRNTKGAAKHTTIMCGIDRDGSQVFVIDARSASRGDNPSLFSNNTSKYSKSRTVNQSRAVQKKRNDWD